MNRSSHVVPKVERKTTCRQFMDGSPVPDPHPPPGDGWTLTHVAAATGGPREKGARLGDSLKALIFYVWERPVAEASE